MPADEFSSWLAYFEVEPYGTHAMEVLISRLLQTQYAASGAKKIPDAEQLMPFVAYRKQMLGPRQKTPEELAEKIRGFTSNAGLKVLRNGG